MYRGSWMYGGLLAAFVGMAAGPAHAAFTIDDWTLDVDGIDGLTTNAANTGAYRYEGVDFMGFTGAIAHAETIDTSGDGLPSTGELGTVEGVGKIATIINDTTGDVLPASGTNDSLLNDPTGEIGVGGFALNGFELEFNFDVDIQFTSNTGTFTHLGPTNTLGVLNILVDNLSDGSTCVQGTGTSCADGTLIASFVILPGQGGSLNLNTLDGSDDALFLATFLAAGVWFNSSGTDLSTLIADDLILGFTDSNFDADPDNNGLGLPAGVDGGFTCGTTLIDFCAIEDGSLRLSQVPEPATLALFGVALLGLGFAARRRRV